MRDAARVMEAALERIAGLADQPWPREQAKSALAEVRALPAGDTETRDQTYSAWFTQWPSTHVNAGQTVEVVPRKLLQAAEARLAQIADALEHAERAMGGWGSGGSLPTALRLARGEEASDG